MKERDVVRRLRDIYKKRESRVDLEVLLAEMLDAFGGARMVAMEYKRVFDAAKTSPMVQQKILLMIQQLIHATTIHQIGKPIDLGQLDDATLRRMLADQMATIHAQPTEEEDPAAPASWPPDDAGADEAPLCGDEADPDAP